MIRRGAVLLVAAAVGCAWSNSLYQARRLSHEAERAEREHRPGDARSLWGQVSVKAESAFARSPRGKGGAEALWLQGHAAVQTGNCAGAIPVFQQALFATDDAPWRQQLLLELGACQEAAGAATASSIFAMLAAGAAPHDSAIRRIARLHQGHILSNRGDWEEALVALRGLDTLPARLDRAMALAQTGRSSAALAELGPPLAAHDTTVDWNPFLTALAASNADATDTLLAGLSAFPNASVDTRSAWLLAAVRGALETDTVQARRRLDALVARPFGRSVDIGRVLQLELNLRTARSVAELRVALDSINARPLPEGNVEVLRLKALLEFAHRVVAVNDSVQPGAPRGDLAMFAIAELARDSLAAPAIGAEAFARLVQQWPASPYVPKALLARAALVPDSASAILARVRADSSNAYVAAARGDVAAQVRRTRLEDSLGRFVRTFTAAPMSRSQPGIQDRE